MSTVPDFSIIKLQEQRKKSCSYYSAFPSGERVLQKNREVTGRYGSVKMVPE